METELRRDELPDDTVDLLEQLAERLNLTVGRWNVRLHFKGGRYDDGWLEEHLTRSAIAVRDAARAEPQP